MLAVEGLGSSAVFVSDHPSGCRVYVDADWIPDGHTGSVSALVVRDGVASFERPGPAAPDRAYDVPVGVSADAAAATVLEDIARRAARVAIEPGRPGAPVMVAGNGAIARSVIAQLGAERFGPDGVRPATVVDVTGAPSVIASALRRLDDLGLLVLVGEPVGRSLDLDLYSDIHVRGLRVVGVPPMSEVVASAVDGMSCGAPIEVALGEPVPHGAAWFAVPIP